MADISGGETFVDGEQVTGGRLNNHVNGAAIQPAFVGGKTLMATADLAGNDSLLVYDLLPTPTLKRTTVTNLLALGGAGTVTSVGLDLPTDTFTVGGNITTAGDLVATHKAQNTGEVHMAPAGAAGVPTWRRLEPRDWRVDAVAIASDAIDWNLSDTFYKTLTGNITLAFTNAIDGRTINVLLGQGGAGTYTVSWVTGGLLYLWPGGTAPVQTTGVGKWDWYQFTLYSTSVFGVRIGANMSP